MYNEWDNAKKRRKTNKWKKECEKHERELRKRVKQRYKMIDWFRSQISYRLSASIRI